MKTWLRYFINIATNIKVSGVEGFHSGGSFWMLMQNITSLHLLNFTRILTKLWNLFPTLTVASNNRINYWSRFKDRLVYLYLLNMFSAKLWKVGCQNAVQRDWFRLFPVSFWNMRIWNCAFYIYKVMARYLKNKINLTLFKCTRYNALFMSSHVVQTS